MNVEVPVVNDGERRNYRLIELTPALADALENDVYP